jgi:hypothetical protein
MLMPVEEDEETEGHNESKKIEGKQWIEKIKIKQGKANFLWEELPSRKWKWEEVIVIQEILWRKRKWWKRKMSKENWKWKNENENKGKKESEGKEEKKHNANK